MLAIPYVRFEISKDGKSNGSYAVDGYFTRFLQHPGRVATLIKKGDAEVFGNPESGDLKLDAMISPEEVKDLLKDVYIDLEVRLDAARLDRSSRRGGWNILRRLIPTGNYFQTEQDKELASEEMESRLALVILKKILNVEQSDEFDSITVIPKGITYYRIDLRKEKKGKHGRKEEWVVVDDTGRKDVIYTNLLSMDDLFREEMMRLFGVKNDKR
ncbi:MAG: hypothetical protein GXO14_02430 [Thermococci archaeon]|nr:hypothetical protein [Thermococci archaeon]